MKVNWLALAHIGNAVVTKIIPAISIAESVGEQFKNLAGRDKENAVLDAIKSEFAIFGKVHGVDLEADPDVEEATRGVVQAIHGLHEIIAKKAAAAGVAV